MPHTATGSVTFKLELRWAHVGRFGYLAIFHVTADEIVVIAVVNAHRDLESILRGRVGVS